MGRVETVPRRAGLRRPPCPRRQPVDHVLRPPSEVALGVLPAMYAALNANLPSYLEAIAEEHGALDTRNEVMD